MTRLFSEIEVDEKVMKSLEINIDKEVEKDIEKRYSKIQKNETSENLLENKENIKKKTENQQQENDSIKKSTPSQTIHNKNSPGGGILNENTKAPTSKVITNTDNNIKNSSKIVQSRPNRKKNMAHKLNNKEKNTMLASKKIPVNKSQQKILIFFFIGYFLIFITIVVGLFYLIYTTKNQTVLKNNSLSNKKINYNDQSNNIKKNTRYINSIKKNKRKSKFIPLEWGDTLVKIAQKEYYNAKFWPFIYIDNEKTISGPEYLIPLKDQVFITYQTNNRNLGKAYYYIYNKYKHTNNKAMLKGLFTAAITYNENYIKGKIKTAQEKQWFRKYKKLKSNGFY